MLIVNRILGEIEEKDMSMEFVERVFVNSSDAVKHRLVARTDKGTDILIDIEPGNYLFDRALIVKTQSKLVYIERESEESVIIKLSRKIQYDEMMKQGALIAHAFGNQHVPIEVENNEIRVPVTTSQEVVRRTISRLNLVDAEISFNKIQLALNKPLLGMSFHH